MALPPTGASLRRYRVNHAARSRLITVHIRHTPAVHCRWTLKFWQIRGFSAVPRFQTNCGLLTVLLVGCDSASSWRHLANVNQIANGNTALQRARLSCIALKLVWYFSDKNWFRPWLPITKLMTVGTPPLRERLLHLAQRGGALAGCGPAQSPSLYQMSQPTHQRPVYRHHIIQWSTIVALAL